MIDKKKKKERLCDRVKIELHDLQMAHTEENHNFQQKIAGWEQRNVQNENLVKSLINRATDRLCSFAKDQNLFLLEAYLLNKDSSRTFLGEEWLSERTNCRKLLPRIVGSRREQAFANSKSTKAENWENLCTDVIRVRVHYEDNINEIVGRALDRGGHGSSGFLEENDQLEKKNHQEEPPQRTWFISDVYCRGPAPPPGYEEQETRIVVLQIWGPSRNDASRRAHTGRSEEHDDEEQCKDYSEELRSTGSSSLREGGGDGNHNDNGGNDSFLRGGPGNDANGGNESTSSGEWEPPAWEKVGEVTLDLNYIKPRDGEPTPWWNSANPQNSENASVKVVKWDATNVEKKLGFCLSTFDGTVASVTTRKNNNEDEDTTWAQEWGMEVGDRVIEIDGVDLGLGCPADELRRLLTKGPKENKCKEIHFCSLISSNAKRNSLSGQQQPQQQSSGGGGIMNLGTTGGLPDPPGQSPLGNPKALKTASPGKVPAKARSGSARKSAHKRSGAGLEIVVDGSHARARSSRNRGSSSRKRLKGRTDYISDIYKEKTPRNRRYERAESSSEADSNGSSDSDSRDCHDAPGGEIIFDSDALTATEGSPSSQRKRRRREKCRERYEGCHEAILPPDIVFTDELEDPERMVEAVEMIEPELRGEEPLEGILIEEGEHQAAAANGSRRRRSGGPAESRGSSRSRSRGSSAGPRGDTRTVSPRGYCSKVNKRRKYYLREGFRWHGRLQPCFMIKSGPSPQQAQLLNLVQHLDRTHQRAEESHALYAEAKEQAEQAGVRLRKHEKHRQDMERQLRDVREHGVLQQNGPSSATLSRTGTARNFAQRTYSGEDYNSELLPTTINNNTSGIELSTVDDEDRKNLLYGRPPSIFTANSSSESSSPLSESNRWLFLAALGELNSLVVSDHDEDDDSGAALRRAGSRTLLFADEFVEVFIAQKWAFSDPDFHRRATQGLLAGRCDLIFRPMGPGVGFEGAAIQCDTGSTVDRDAKVVPLPITSKPPSCCPDDPRGPEPNNTSDNYFLGPNNINKVKRGPPKEIVQTLCFEMTGLIDQYPHLVCDLSFADEFSNVKFKHKCVVHLPILLVKFLLPTLDWGIREKFDALVEKFQNTSIVVDLKSRKGPCWQKLLPERVLTLAGVFAKIDNNKGQIPEDNSHKDNSPSGGLGGDLTTFVPDKKIAGGGNSMALSSISSPENDKNNSILRLAASCLRHNFQTEDKRVLVVLSENTLTVASPERRLSRSVCATLVEYYGGMASKLVERGAGDTIA